MENFESFFSSLVCALESHKQCECEWYCVKLEWFFALILEFSISNFLAFFKAHRSFQVFYRFMDSLGSHEIHLSIVESFVCC